MPKNGKERCIWKKLEKLEGLSWREKVVETS